MNQSSNYKNILDTSIEFIKGVGPAKADILKKEIRVFTWRDLLMIFPFRYVDKTSFQTVSQIREDGQVVQLKGKIISAEKIKGKGTRLSAIFRDSSGFVELVWFRGVSWMSKYLEEGKEYIVYGKINIYKGKKSIPHPEIELPNQQNELANLRFDPVYHSTDKLNGKGLDSKNRKKFIAQILSKINPADLPENLSSDIITKLKLCSRYQSIQWIHIPQNQEQLQVATNRIKFEELLFLQLRLLRSKVERAKKYKGAIFEKIGDNFNYFFKNKLPFELTNAQKKILKEIRKDLKSGIQMNRLLQGDVGSGKTIVGLMTMLMALDNGYQACLMAPTEILAQQHFTSISEQIKGMDITVGFLSGTVKGKKRKTLLESLQAGEIDILIGTHALIEDPVVFKNLGLAITDEQHRFGVAQRAKLWMKNKEHPPHVLVMTATPIPRTLAMTVYGDLDVSVIDELPPGRKNIKTIHRTESKRAEVISFMHHEIKKGRQIYIVFPLIEESETLDLQNLQEGYERLLQYFPKPKFQISVVHGRMKAADKDQEMQRFVDGNTQIMVATTVIEVGVNVPNASVMIIENTERFGLSQLHQLRGRVGRGAEQSYCILMSGYKLSKEARERIKTMCQTNNGFEIAEVDMRLRGHGNIEGTQQSGVMDFKLVNLVRDGQILQTARHIAQDILHEDPNLTLEKNAPIANFIRNQGKKFKNWGRIS